MAERRSEIWDSGRAGAGWPDYPSHANGLPPLLGPSQAWGLSAGRSCFPFLLNHTAAIWTRLSLHDAAAALPAPIGPLQTGLALRAPAPAFCSNA
ncbi:hypothetical protein PAMP_001983 [Pampus punctatissimus]